MRIDINQKNARRIDRLSAQLRMTKGDLVDKLLTMAVMEVDGNLAMNSGDPLEPALCEDYDATTGLDGMTVAEVLAADAGGRFIQRQHFLEYHPNGLGLH